MLFRSSTTKWKKLKTIIGKGNEENNFIDLTNLEFEELYLHAKHGGHMYNEIILKDEIPTDRLYIQLGIDINYRVEVAINSNNLYITCQKYYDKELDATLSVYYM